MVNYYPLVSGTDSIVKKTINECDLYFILTKYRNKINDLHLKYRIGRIFKNTSISVRCRSFVGGTQTSNTKQTVDEIYTEALKNDINLKQLTKYLKSDLTNALKNKNSILHLVAPNKIYNGNILDSFYQDVKNTISTIGDKNINSITFEQLTSEDIDFLDSIAKLKLCDEDYYVLPLDDKIWNKRNNSKNTTEVSLLYSTGNVGLYPFKKRAKEKPQFITIPVESL